MRQLDPQEEKIVKALIKDPRSSDNKIGKETRVPIRTVSRKRRRLEEEGLIQYFTNLSMDVDGTGRFGARHLYIIKFKIGVTREKIFNEIRHEPNVKTIFTELIWNSHLAEVDGHIALAMLIEGRNDAEIVESVQSRIIPSLRKNHGKDSIVGLSTIRLHEPIRLFHNYLPSVNMKNGKMAKDWPEHAIFVG